MEPSASERQAQQMEMQLQVEIVRFFKCCGVVLPIWLLGHLGFSVSWLLIGTTAYVITTFVKEQRRRRTSAARRLADNEQEVLANLDNLPSWVFFPDVERAEWLNMVMRQAWPFVRGYAVDLINSSIIPSVKANLPPTFSTFTFTSLDLGDNAPRIGGIKVYRGESIRRSEIVMDVDLMYFGDSNIELKWKAFKAGITDLEFRGKARVVISPLMSKMPIAGSVSITLLQNPYINFDLTNLGNVLDMPGLRQMLVKVITDQVAAMLVLPKRMVVPLAPNLDLSEIRYPLPQGVLRLHIIEASDLEKSDVGLLKKGKSDPYVVAKVGQQTFRTKTIENNVSPEWNEKFEAVVHVRSGQSLELSVFDEDPGSKDDPLGTATVQLEDVSAAGSIDTWIKLDDVKTGSIRVKLLWANLIDDATRLGPKAEGDEDSLSRAFLFVEVDSCRGLPSLPDGQEPSALVNLSVGGGAEQTTQVVQASPNPVFEAGFNFLVGNPSVESLDIVVHNASKDGACIGRKQLPLRSLVAAQGMQLNRSYVLTSPDGKESQISLRLALRALVEGRAAPAAAEAQSELRHRRSAEAAADKQQN